MWRGEKSNRCRDKGFHTFNHNSWTFSNFILPQVIFHTHTDYATALGCLRTSEFPMIHQNGIRFFGRVAFHEEYGLPSDKDESELLGTYFARDKTDVMFMCTHGMQVFYKIQKKKS